MRNIIYLLLLSALILVRCSSSDDPVDDSNDNNNGVVNDPQEPEEDFLNVDADTVRFNADSRAGVVVLHCNNSWSLESDASWVELSQKSGSAGRVSLVVKAMQNDNIYRMATLYIKSADITHELVVVQQGADELCYSINGEEFKLIYVEGGVFDMGDSEAVSFESASRKVSLKGFYICESEVTNALWEEIVGGLPYDTIEDFQGYVPKPLEPVSGVTYSAVVNEFLPKLKDRIGIEVNLPTEAQWEYAASGGNKSKGYTYAGSNDLKDYAWQYLNSDDKKHEIKTKLPNELGLYDMSGNVEEWCSDWFQSMYFDEDAYFNQEPEVDPQGPESGTYKVVRGGNYSTVEMVGIGRCAIKYRTYRIPGLIDGCWGNTGDIDEPMCFFGAATGFRFVIAVNE